MKPWWTEPMASATFWAAARSGEPFRPMAKVCSRGHQAGPGLSTRLSAIDAARAATTELSSPPESSTP